MKPLRISSTSSGPSFSWAKEARDAAAVPGDQPVAELHAPDERSHLEKARRARPTDLAEDEQSGATGTQQPSVPIHDVQRLLALAPQLGRQRRALVGDELEVALRVMPPDPGSEAASEQSIAVPEDPWARRMEGGAHRSL